MKNKRPIWNIVTYFCLGFAAIFAIFMDHSFVETSPVRSHTPKTTASLAWITEEWTGEEKPYQEIRQATDKKIASGISPTILAFTYQVKSTEKDNPIAVFRWAYPAYLAA